MAEMGGRSTRMTIMGTPFYYQVNSSGVAGFVSEDSPLSFTSGIEAIYLDLFALGGRFQAFAALYQKYRVLKGSILWKPSISFGATAGAEILNLTFGWLPDPGSTVPGSFTLAARSGGITTITNKQARAAIGRSSWLFTNTATSTPTIIDLRECAFGALYAYLDSPTSGGIIDMGYFEVVLDLEFKGARDGVTVGEEKTVLPFYQQQVAIQRSPSLRVPKTASRRTFPPLPEETKTPAVSPLQPLSQEEKASLIKRFEAMLERSDSPISAWESDIIPRPEEFPDPADIGK
jgi:hypothetical protein